MIKIGAVNIVGLEALIKKVNPLIDNASVVLANEYAKIAKQYTPYRSGDLERSLRYFYEGRRVVALVYNISYAKKIWYGDPNWNYNTSVNRFACPRWTERSWLVHGKDIINNVNKALKNV